MYQEYQNKGRPTVLVTIDKQTEEEYLYSIDELINERDYTFKEELNRNKLLFIYGSQPTSKTAESGQSYFIEVGDTLGAIASKFNTTVEKILKLNPDNQGIKDRNTIYPNYKIIVKQKA